MSTENITHAICFGEVLWDMLPDGPQPGGAPLNVAYQLNKLGLKTQMISRIGADEKGMALKSLLEKWAIGTQLLQIDPQHATSEVIASLTDANEVKYEILFPVAWDFIQSGTEPQSAVAAAKYFIYGSLASRHQKSCGTLLDLLEHTKAIKVLDVNFRPPFVNAEALEPLLLKADIVKLNEAELAQMQVLFQGVSTGEEAQVQFIQDRFQIAEVIITKGASGASYYNNSQVFQGYGQEVKVEDTIGSGDAFLAAFVAGHHLGLPPEEMLSNAMDLGAFIATKKGGCPDYEIAEYDQFKRK